MKEGMLRMALSPWSGGLFSRFKYLLLALIKLSADMLIGCSDRDADSSAAMSLLLLTWAAMTN